MKLKKNLDKCQNYYNVQKQQQSQQQHLQQQNLLQQQQQQILQYQNNKKKHKQKQQILDDIQDLINCVYSHECVRNVHAKRFLRARNYLHVNQSKHL